MTKPTIAAIATAAFAVLASILLIALEDGSGGLTREAVREIARSEVANAGVPFEPGLSQAAVEEIVREAILELYQGEPTLTRADVEQIVQAAITELPRGEPGLTRADVELIVEAAITELRGRITE